MTNKRAHRSGFAEGAAGKDKQKGGRLLAANDPPFMRYAHEWGTRRQWLQNYWDSSPFAMLRVRMTIQEGGRIGRFTSHPRCAKDGAPAWQLVRELGEGELQGLAGL